MPHPACVTCTAKYMCALCHTHAGAVLYLKSLDLEDLDVLEFDFLDPPGRDALEVGTGGRGGVTE